MRAALNEAGIDERDTYVTNAVKHFKFIERGQWLEAEIAVVPPPLIVALGATAAKTLLGPAFRITSDRGTIVQSALGLPVIAMVHPSSILRAPDDDTPHEARAAAVTDLRHVAAFGG